MILEKALEMFNNEIDDFEKEQEKIRGLKMLVDFDSAVDYDSKEMDFEIKPKFKKKLEAAIYIKADKNTKSLF